MAKKKSHTAQVFHDILIEIPIIGKPIHNLLNRKGEVMKKIGGFGLILMTVIILTVAFLIWLHFQQPTTSNSPTSTQSGNNNALIQNSPNATLNYGVSDETYKQMQEGMLAVQKLKDAQLRAEYDIGYIIFTATERNEIVPLKSPMDNIIIVDWKSGYLISSSSDTVKFRFPDMVVRQESQNGGGAVELGFNGCTATMPKRENITFKAIALNDVGVDFKIVSISKDSIVIAMGVKNLK
jgi:hypothetical protein